jgi:hypothetical protein
MEVIIWRRMQMMKQINKVLIVIVLLAACKPSDNDIKALLQSKNIED